MIYDYSLWYCEEDSAVAEDITNTLDSKDLRRFVDHVDEVAGELAIKAVTNVIQSSRCSVVVLSPQSLQSAWYRSIMHWSLQQCLEPSVLFNDLGTRFVPGPSAGWDPDSHRGLALHYVDFDRIPTTAIDCYVMSHLNKTPADKERFVCIYPAYLNSKKTIAEGRRVPKDKAVENPTYVEIRDVLVAAGMNVVVENKMYPREWNRDVQFRGRIRVQLKNEDGSPVLEAIPTRQALFTYTADMIPKLKARTTKTGGAEPASQPGDSSRKGKKKKK
ncbi:unnamed protein product [Lampetra fluviatilis]